MNIGTTKVAHACVAGRRVSARSARVQGLVRAALAIASLALAGCGATTLEGELNDAGAADTARVDVPTIDVDINTSDAGGVDTGAEDAGGGSDAAVDVASGDAGEDSASSDAEEDAPTDASDDGGVGADTSADAVADASLDAEADAPVDAPVDAVGDAESDAGSDAGSDASADAADAADVGEDAEADAEGDAEADGEGDVDEDSASARCGDGIVQRGEACDDGNDVDDDACSNACERPELGLCEPCLSDAYCGSEADRCLEASDGLACASSCASEEECDEGYRCADVEGSGQCVPATGWCGPCPDADADTVCDDADLCVGGDDRADADADGVPDDCDVCPGADDALDADFDGVADGCDACPGEDDRLDANTNGVPDGCDPTSEVECDDGVDDDNDGAVDCEDIDCALACVADSCDATIPVLAFAPIEGSTAGAASTLTGSCGVDEGAPELVYELRVGETTTVCANTFGSALDTRLYVLEACAADAPEAACSDDAEGSRQSEVEFEALAGETYYIVVDGYDGAAGGFTLSLEPAACAPPTEVCTGGVDEDGDELTDCEDPDCVDDPACAPPTEVCTGGVDEDGDELTDCEDPDCAADPACEAPPAEVCAGGVDEDGDELTDCEDPDCATDPACFIPPDGSCVAPFVVSGSATLSGTTSGVGEHTSVCQTNSGADEVVYAYTATASGPVCVDTAGTSHDTVVYVRSACTDGASEIACNDDAPSGGLQSELSFEALAGSTYFVFVDGYDLAAGDYSLRLFEGGCDAIPPGPGACDNPLTAAIGTTTGTTLGSGGDFVLSCGSDGSGPGVAHTFIPDASGTYCANTFGSSFDTRLAVRTTCEDPADIVCNDDTSFEGSTLQSQVQFDALSGVPITLIVEGYSSAAGNYSLNVQPGACP